MTYPQHTLSLLILGVLLLTACADPHDPDQVRFCKALARAQAGAISDWRQVTTQLHDAQGMEVRLVFEAASHAQPWQVACRFEYDAPEDTALTLANPTSAYASSPSAVTINGRTLSRAELAEAVKQALLDQGRDLMERAGQALR